MENTIAPSISILYSKIQRLPRTEWPSMIATLDSTQKNLLMQYLSDKDIKKISIDTHPTETASQLNSESNLSHENLNNKHFNESLNELTNQICEIPNHNKLKSSSQIPISYNIPKVNTVQKFNSEFITENIDISHSKEKKNERENNQVMMMVPLKYFIEANLFISGDGQFPHSESISWVHGYLNTWLSFIWCKFIISQSQENNKKTKRDTLFNFLFQYFPDEIKRFSSNQKLFKNAHNLFRFTGKIHNLNSLENQFDMNFKSIQEDYNIKELQDSKFDLFAILPSERFDYRLKLRDLRTSLMDSHQYQDYISTRSKSFHLQKRLIANWLNQIACSETYLMFLQYFSKDLLKEAPISSNLDFSTLRSSFTSSLQMWIFLIIDRISSIVELVDRLSLFNVSKDSEIKSTKITDMFIPSIELSEMFEIHSKNKDFLFTETLNSSFYKTSIFLFLSKVDSNLLTFEPTTVYYSLKHNLEQITNLLSSNTKLQFINNENQFNTTDSYYNYSDQNSQEILDNSIQFDNFSEPNLKKMKIEKLMDSSINTTTKGDLYTRTGIDIANSSLSDLGLEGLWAKFVDKSEIHCRQIIQLQHPNINEFMLFVSIRLKELLWEYRENTDSSKIFGILLSEWQKISEDKDNQSIELCFSELQSSIKQLQKYMDIANKIYKVFKYFSDVFPDIPLLNQQF